MRQLKRLARIAVCAGAACGLPAMASAQSSSPRAPKWAIDVYTGAAAVSGSTGGTAATDFPAGSPFTTVAGRPSRVVPSWFFGDGAALLNDVLSQFAAAGATTFPRIKPLDAALRAGGSSDGHGAVFGARLSRDISRRLAIEVSADRRTSSHAFGHNLTDALEAARDSFKSAFDAFLATVPATGLNVSSTLSTTQSAGHQVQLGGALRWRLAARGRLGAYLTGGGGVAMTTGGAPEATLNGAYSFRLLSTYGMAETDRVTIKVAPAKTAALGFAGAGATWDLSRHLALKADVRVSFVSANAVTTIRAAPSSEAQSPTAVLPSLTSPSIQFSTQSSIPSSLGGASSEMTTFTAAGWDRHVAATIAIVRRF
jgi:hypothetical protein